jgi:ArsR family transcriptional regulator
MITKTTDRAQLARWFYVLSDETRLRVVELLGGGERCVCELQQAIGATQSRLSFHLKVLRDAGLVHDRRAGRWVHYSLRPEVLEEIGAFVLEHTPPAAGWARASGDAGGRDVASCS